jgi:hypothetical protein
MVAVVCYLVGDSCTFIRGFDGQLNDYYGILQDITKYTFGGQKPFGTCDL